MTTSVPLDRTRIGAVLAVAGMACVGSSVAVSQTIVDAPLFTLQAVRYAMAAVLLLVIAVATGRSLPRPRGTEWLWLAGVATSGLVVFNVAVVRGVAHAEPAVIGVAVASVPVLLAVAGPLFGGGRPAPAVVVAAVVVTAGAVLVQGGGRTDAAGIAWALLVLVCEAGFTLLAVPVLARLGPWAVSLHSVWIAALALAGIGLVVEGPAAAGALGAGDLLAAVHLAVVVTALAFVLWYSAVGRLGAGRAGLFTGVVPVSAAIGGVLLGGPVPALTVWLGAAVVAAGLVVGFGGPRTGSRSTARSVMSQRTRL
ncbi:DMT family transporter [Pseudonocardia nigra]|uniref:DMT family transporter n=1 Tax=Pseudonocardia nigra TaxID=1921578 RepID=UPI001C5E1E0E|nr:DMT family transporter [Pseudonocardia nigra]